VRSVRGKASDKVRSGVTAFYRVKAKTSKTLKADSKKDLYT
jgi:hypothetical protein